MQNNEPDIEEEISCIFSEELYTNLYMKRYLSRLRVRIALMFTLSSSSICPWSIVVHSSYTITVFFNPAVDVFVIFS